MSKGPITIAALMPHPPILIPAVGRDRLADVQTSLGAMRELSRAVVATQPDSVVVISPHSPRAPFAFGVWTCAELRGSFAPFNAPDATVSLPTDREFVEALARTGIHLNSITGGALDHGAMVPLWFLAEAGWRGPTVVLSLNHPGAGGIHDLGRAIAAAAKALGRKIALIASGDMSHRLIPGAPAGFEPTAKEFDARFVSLLREHAYRDIERINPVLQARAAEDVVDSTAVAMAATEWRAEGGRVLSYEGPFGVGYTVAVLYAADADDSDESTHGRVLPRIARRAAEAAFARDPLSPPPPRGDYLQQNTGVFVTIKTSGGRLRGCMGSLQRAATPNVVAETWRNSRLAAFNDPRFPKVTPVELHNLRFEVSVLHSFEEIATQHLLDPLRYGVIVSTADGRRATLLPGIVGIETIEQQWRTVCQKGGIAHDETVRIIRYQADKFSE
jgi:MEMO1 family protein